MSLSGPTRRVWRIVRKAWLPMLLGVITTFGVALLGPVLLKWEDIALEHARDDGARRRLRAPVWSTVSTVLPPSKFRVHERGKPLSEWFRTMRRGEFVDGPGALVNAGPDEVMWKHVQSGWPCAACYGWEAKWFSLEDFRLSDDGAGIIEMTMVRVDPRRSRTLDVPYLPIWRGVILNSVFFGACWWGLFASIGGARRALRRRRGRCVRCGYDRTGLPQGAVCPECGG